MRIIITCIGGMPLCWVRCLIIYQRWVWGVLAVYRFVGFVVDTTFIGGMPLCWVVVDISHSCWVWMVLVACRFVVFVVDTTFVLSMEGDACCRGCNLNASTCLNILIHFWCYGGGMQLLWVGSISIILRLNNVLAACRSVGLPRLDFAT